MININGIKNLLGEYVANYTEHTHHQSDKIPGKFTARR